MPPPEPGGKQDAASYQRHFHRRWNHLQDRHVRTLAWLLDAPDLLDANAAAWQGKVATLGPVDAATAAWLAELDAAPEALHAALPSGPFTRLGRYAESLMAFYLAWQGRLIAHGVQVRGEKNETVGEFDFIVRDGAEAVHWEFATKLYLLETCGKGRHADYFVGPNLADTLGAKVRKIMQRQLALSSHPNAINHLPEPVHRAQALVKGWLFYQGGTPDTIIPEGIGHCHCRGFWNVLDGLDDLASLRYVILPRLQWLAPGKFRENETCGLDELRGTIRAHFGGNTMPVLVSVLETDGGRDGWLLETDRGFIVPDDWSRRAAAMG
ncbi:DUF1853 family protein [Noviherbaspirillum galbum]|uniref:DUF1853 family protein n=1 Tax=Noviherbaspirillum galbum TaxID=2709383 RepID=A0A6B3SQ09_9BURK|nr:DUF1853 family protein [Noviherbaspirillum galbum]NEX62837.1 DUF1853 family protein [Noviherbaspirillum galbum]